MKKKKMGLLTKLGTTIFVSLILLNISLPFIYALPEGEQVMVGSASFDRSQAHTLEITVSDKAIVNYNSFNISGAETIRFIQPSRSSSALNRVTGSESSSILGSLFANGQVFLVNPNGIFFGPHANIDVGSFFASTLDIADSDFLSDNYRFFLKEETLPSYIINQGTIKADPRGFVVLQAPLVSNEGVIVADLGNVVVAGASQSSLSFDEERLISFAVPRMEQEPGTIFISKDQASNLIKTVVNTPSIIEAGEIIEEGGRVKLVGVEGLSFNSGEISTNGVSGQDAGSVLVTSRQAAVLTADSVITANGQGENSSGGDIRIVSDDSLQISPGARLEAKGGEVSGDGGFIEISGLCFNLNPGVVIDTSSTNGCFGTFLLDPGNIIIQDNSGSNVNIDDSGSPWATTNDSAVIDVGLLQSAFQSSSIIIRTGVGIQAGDITVSDSIDVDNCSSNSLTLQAHRNITLNTPIFTDSNSATEDAVNLTLTADWDGNDVGNVDISAVVNTYGGSFASGGIDFDNTGGGISTGGGSVTIANSGVVTVGSAINTTGGTGGINFSSPGSLNLKGNLRTDGGNISVGGTPDIIVGASVTIDTESGNDNDAGNIYFGSLGGLNIYADAAGYDLSLITTTGAGYESGDIGVGLVDDNAGGNNYINNLILNAMGGGTDPFQDCGLVSLKENIYVDDDGSGNPGSVTIGGRVKYMTSVTIDTEQAGNTNGGIVNMSYANTAADAASSYDVTIDTSTSLLNGDGGAVSLYKLGHLSGQAEYVRNFILTTSGNGTGTAGAVSITGGVNTTGTQTYTTGSIGTVTLDGNIGTENQNITFSADTPVSLGAAISMNAGTGTITFNSTLAGGNYDLNFVTDGIDFLGGDNSVTGSGDISFFPSSAGESIGIAGGAGTLQLTAADISALANGFSNIFIGHTDGAGAVRIANPVTFSDPVTIRSPAAGGTVIVNGQIDGNDDASITLNSHAAPTLNAPIVTADNPIEIATVNGDINITDTAAANDLDAGTSTVTLNAGGANNTLTVASGVIVSGTGGIYYTADNISLIGSTNAGTAMAELTQITNEREIDLGSETAGKLSLTDSELDSITAGKIIIGNANSGEVTVTADVNPSNADSVQMITGSNFEFNSSLTVTDSIELTASGSILDNDDAAAYDIICGGQATLNTSSGTIGLSSNPLEVNVGGLLYVGAGRRENNISAVLNGTSSDNSAHLLYEPPGLVLFNNEFFGGIRGIIGEYCYVYALLNPYIANVIPAFGVERFSIIDEVFLKEEALPF